MKNLLAVLLISLGLQASLSAQVITDFGTGQFTVNTSVTDFTTTQTATATRIQGSDFGSMLVGTFATINISAATTQLSFTGTLSGTNPNSAFSISVLDSGGKVAEYGGNWSSFTSGAAGTVVLNRISVDPGFNGTINTLALNTGGTGSSIDFSMDRLQAVAVPEPSTMSLGVMALVAGFLMFRRRALRACEAR